jgi:hypothetical protein
MWILPNTQKYWKMWSENFMKLMLMFPMIMGLLAVGKVFAYITASIKASGGLESTVNYFVILIAYFGPFLLIPKTFSLSGSILASASGAVNKMSGKISAPSQKLIKEKGTDWAQSKYKPGQPGRNALVRLGTGKLIPTTKSSARLANNRLKYIQELEGQGNALVGAELEGQNYSDQGKKLQELANSGNRIVSEAALRRINETGRHELLDGIDQKKIKSYADKNADFGKGIAQKRRDLVDPSASQKMVTKDYVGSHDSLFGSVDANGAYTPPTGDHAIDFNDEHVQEQLRAIAGDQTLYNQMGNAAKHIIGPPTFAGGGGPAAGGGGPAAGGGGGGAFTYTMPTGTGTRSSSTGGSHPPAPTPPPTQPPSPSSGPTTGGGSSSSATGGTTNRTTIRWS